MLTRIHCQIPHNPCCAVFCTYRSHHATECRTKCLALILLGNSVEVDGDILDVILGDGILFLRNEKESEKSFEI